MGNRCEKCCGPLVGERDWHASNQSRIITLCRGWRPRDISLHVAYSKNGRPPADRWAGDQLRCRCCDIVGFVVIIMWLLRALGTSCRHRFVELIPSTLLNANWKHLSLPRLFSCLIFFSFCILLGALVVYLAQLRRRNLDFHLIWSYLSL